MTVHILPPVPDAQVLAAIAGLPLVPWSTGVFQAGRLIRGWARPDEDAEALRYTQDSGAGRSVVQTFGESADLDAAITAAFATTPTDDLFAALAHRDDPIALIEAIYRAKVVQHIVGDAPSDALDLHLVPLLTHDDARVRAVVGRTLSASLDATIEQALADAATAHPELIGVHAHVAANRQAHADGTLFDEPTDSWWELVRRGREGLAAEQLVRVETAMDALLDLRLDHPEGLMIRALAYEQRDEPTLARMLAGAVRRQVVPDIENYDEGDSDHDRGVRLTAEANELLARLADAPIDPADTGKVEDWLTRFGDDDRSYCLAGAFRVLVDLLPDYEAAAAWHVGWHDSDTGLLARARALAPDAPSLLATLGMRTAGADGEALMREALDAFTRFADDPTAFSAPARLIERVAAAYSNQEPDDVRKKLLEHIYEAQRWQEAADLADAIVAEDPKNAIAWQIRANARIFGDRVEESVAAYHEAIDALTATLEDTESIWFGSDPRPGMRFNLACALGRLGRRSELLDTLRLLLRDDPDRAEAVEEEEWLEDFHDDPEFQRIVALDPDALVLAHERERPFIAALTQRALGRSYRGDVDEAVEDGQRAASLAAAEGFPDLEAKALSIVGRTLAFYDDEDEGLATARTAADLVIQSLEHPDRPTIDPETSAEVMNNLATVLHACGLLDEAEGAYERALTLRVAAYGDAHPALAKSYGDLARLAHDRGEDGSSWTERGANLLEEWLAAAPAEDPDEAHGDTRIEALIDLANLRSNAAHVLRLAGDFAGAEASLVRCLDLLEDVVARGQTVADPMLEHVEAQCDLLVDASGGEHGAELPGRFELLTLSDDPREQQERLFWRRLRRFARQMNQHGVADADIAATLTSALRGEPLPPALASVPEIASFAPGLAERVARYPTLLALSAMALGTVEGGGDLDEALENLEELCVAQMWEGLGEGDDLV